MPISEARGVEGLEKPVPCYGKKRGQRRRSTSSSLVSLLPFPAIKSKSPLMVAVEGCGCCACDSSAERWREGGARRGESASPATLSAIPATYWPKDVRKLIVAAYCTALHICKRKLETDKTLDTTKTRQR